MNRAVLQTSSVQQMTSTTGGNPNYWWNMNNNIIRPPPSPPLAPLLSPPPDHYTPPVPPPPPPPYFSNMWVDNIQELPPESISWSQLLLGGLVDENEKSDLSNNNNIMQRKKLGMMENWQLLQPSNGSLISDDVREEHSTKSYMYYNYDDNEEEHDGRVVAKSSWLPMPPAVSPPTSCTTALNSNKLVDLSRKILDGRRHPSADHSSECNSTGAVAGATKKARVQPSLTQSAFKVRKEKLGDRITALHQLVSPFGKTDTASVLLEAIGYIRFLHTQIQALTQPYFGNTSGKMRLKHQQQNECCEEPKKDLNSIGLCLVPVSSTLQVGNNYNGADYWAPALGSGSGGSGGGFR